METCMAKFCKGRRPVLIRACRPAKKNQKKTCDTLLNYYPNLNKNKNKMLDAWLNLMKKTYHLVRMTLVFDSSIILFVLMIVFTGVLYI